MPIPYPNKKALFYLAALAGLYLGVEGKLPKQDTPKMRKASPAQSPGELAAFAEAAGSALQFLDSKPSMGFDSRPAERAATAIMVAGKVADGLSSQSWASRDAEETTLPRTRLNSDGEQAL